VRKNVFKPGWARWVGEKIWHESKKIAKLPDGGLEITFRVAGLDEIKRWILSFGPRPLFSSRRNSRKWVVRIYRGIWFNMQRAQFLLA